MRVPFRLPVHHRTDPSFPVATPPPPPLLPIHVFLPHFLSSTLFSLRPHLYPHARCHHRCHARFHACFHARFHYRFHHRRYLPGAEIETDADLAVAAGNIGTSIFHPVGTCRMGGFDDDEDAVVDPRLRVRGIGGEDVGRVYVQC